MTNEITDYNYISSKRRPFSWADFLINLANNFFVSNFLTGGGATAPLWRRYWKKLFIKRSKGLNDKSFPFSGTSRLVVARHFRTKYQKLKLENVAVWFGRESVIPRPTDNPSLLNRSSPIPYFFNRFKSMSKGRQQLMPMNMEVT